MGISIPKNELRRRLDDAVGLAESDAQLPPEWLKRTVRMGQCPAQTYVAALGTALLARATDDRVDSLTVKSKAGPTAYSMRGVVSVLAERASHYGYHLGVTGPEPLNNQPWFGGDRVDRFASVRSDVLPFQRDMVRYLRDLNHLAADEAQLALAAFLRVRLSFARDLAEAAASREAQASDDLEQLVEIAELFVTQDPEGGRRGQALVAALFDLLGQDVRLSRVSDPTGIDVAILREGKVLLAAEVKQKPATEATAIHLAEAASDAGSDKALLVAIAKDQPPLDRETIRHESEASHGVLTLAFDSIHEAIGHIVLLSPLTSTEAAQRLPALYLNRMQEHEVSPEGQAHWEDLCASLHHQQADASDGTAG